MFREFLLVEIEKKDSRWKFKVIKRNKDLSKSKYAGDYKTVLF